MGQGGRCGVLPVGSSPHVAWQLIDDAGCARVGSMDRRKSVEARTVGLLFHPASQAILIALIPTS
jgi:hypothetical protein